MQYPARIVAQMVVHAGSDAPDLAAPSRMMYDTHDKGVTNVESERAERPEVRSLDSSETAPGQLSRDQMRRTYHIIESQ